MDCATTRTGRRLARQQEHLRGTSRPSALLAAAGAEAEREDNREKGLHEVLQEEKAETKPEVQIGLGLDVGSVEVLVGARIEVVNHRVVRDCSSFSPFIPTETERGRNAQTHAVVLSVVEYCYAAQERVA